MALGELLIDPGLFSGFLLKPNLWAGIFIETSMATLVISLIGLFVLSKFRLVHRGAFVVISAVTWLLLSFALVALYAHFYWVREWHLTILTPGLIFGWIIPGCLTIGCLVLFSLGLRPSSHVVRF